jgi:antitoxin MazE
MEGAMHTKVQRWGNSLAVRIPKAFAQGIGLEEDSPVEISTREGDLVISRITPPPFTLDQLLAGITDDNLHEEIAVDQVLGNEAW